MGFIRQLNHVTVEWQAIQLLWNRKNVLSKFSIATAAHESDATYRLEGGVGRRNYRLL